MIVTEPADHSGLSNLIPSRRSSSGLATFALKTLLASAFGLSVAFVLYLFVPFRDPLDVVGPALMRGYSEAAEQWALYGFWMATLAAAVALNLFHRAWLSAAGQWAGAIACLLLIVAPLVAESPLTTIVMLVTWGTAYVCGGYASSVIERRFGLLRWPWIGVLFWLAGYHGMLLNAFNDPRNHLQVLVVIALLLAGLQFWQHKAGNLVARRIFAMAALAMLAATVNTLDHLWKLSLSATVAYGLGIFARSKVGSTRSQSAWMAFLLCVFLTAYRYRMLAATESRLLCGLGGIGIGAVLHCLMQDWTIPVREWKTFREYVLRYRFVVFVGLAVGFVIWRSNWVVIAIVLLGLMVVLSRGQLRPWRFWRSTGVGCLLALAVVPVLQMLPLDTFHDGYNLTCAWAFESGRQLYTEILPIRSYQFFVTWLSRRVLPQTVDAYLLTFSVLQLLPIIGAFALSMVWTRGRVWWSVSTGMIVMALAILDSRQATHLLLAAMMLSALRRDRHATWWLIGFGSVLAAACGFDTLCPLAAANILTLFCVPSTQRFSSQPSLWQRVLRATQAVVLTIVPFSLLIAVWQGPSAAAEYWFVLRDFAAHFNAFSGLPLEWQEPSTRLQVGLGIMVLAVWISGGVTRWPMMSPARRRAWLFLMIQYGFLLHRGVGRSDHSHLQDAMIPSLVLLSLGLFECVKILRHARQTPVWFTPTNVAWLVIASICAVHENPVQPLNGPLMISKATRILQGHDPIPLGEIDYVQQTVAPHETLWTIENTTSNFANSRPLATRHPLAHIICSPSEQRRAVADLRHQPPRLIEWPTKGITTVSGPPESLNEGNFGTVCVILSHDGIAAPLRYYIIFQDLLPKYRPTDQPGYLEPAPPDWIGLEQLPKHLNRTLDCQRLPLVWGEQRVPRLGARIGERNRLPKFSQDESQPADGFQWELAIPLEPRRFNRLLMTFSASGESSGSGFSTATLQFTPDVWDDQTSSMTFDCPLDGREHSYLVPVGSCPAWVWRRCISRLRLQAPAECRVSAPHVEAWFVDELSP